MRDIAFEVDDLRAAVDRLVMDGYGLVGSIGRYENIWRRTILSRHTPRP